MAKSETLSVRLDPKTRQILAAAASTHDVAGASALARTILEDWASKALAEQTRSGIERATAYLLAHPDGWDDEPADFFPSISEVR